MMPRISPRDEQLLSDYLDGQLSARESASFEKRLREEDALRAAAADLRRMKVVLRSAPRYRVPRNFTLTPAMVGKPRASGFGLWIPILRFSSIAAVFLLVAAFLLQWLPSRGAGLPAAPAPAAAPVMEAPAAESVTQASQEASPQPMILWNGQPATGRGGGGPPVGAAQPMEAPAIEKQMEAQASGAEVQPDMQTAAPAEEGQALMAPAAPPQETGPLATPAGQELYGPLPTSTAAGEFGAPSAALPAAPAAAPPLPAATQAAPANLLPPSAAEAPADAQRMGPDVATAEAAATEVPAPAAGAADIQPTILGIRPTDQRAMLVTPEGQIAGQPSAPLVDETAKTSPAKDNDVWLWIKVILALAALSTGTAAVILKRRVRK